MQLDEAIRDLDLAADRLRSSFDRTSVRVFSLVTALIWPPVSWPELGLVSAVMKTETGPDRCPTSYS
jgi:hypothetical protein